MIVLKFGGTSVGNLSAMRKVASILKNAKKPAVAVVSAMSGVTDELLSLGALSLKQHQPELTARLGRLKNRHFEVLRKTLAGKESKTEENLKKLFEELDGVCHGISLVDEMSPRTKDYLVSFGERASSLLVEAVCQSQGISCEALDTRILIRTDSQFGEAQVMWPITKKKLKTQLAPLLKRGKVPILTGFIGSDTDGNTTTLGRGGSDYSASIVGCSLGAKEIQIWTDVDGFLNADPRVIPQARLVPELSFREAAELAYFGAKVLHPKTIAPAVASGIPVRILNTFRPKGKGSLITDREIPSLKSVSYKKGITVIHMSSPKMLDAYGFLSQIFEVFADFEIPVDVVSTSEVSVSVTIEEKLSTKHLKTLVQELAEFCDVRVFHHKAIICLVGEGIRSHKKILPDLFLALTGIEVTMVSQGASFRNVTLVINEADVSRALKSLYHQFFKGKTRG